MVPARNVRGKPFPAQSLSWGQTNLQVGEQGRGKVFLTRAFPVALNLINKYTVSASGTQDAPDSSVLVLNWADLRSLRTNPREGAAAPPTGPFPTLSPAFSSLVRNKTLFRNKTRAHPSPVLVSRGLHCGNGARLCWGAGGGV